MQVFLLFALFAVAAFANEEPDVVVLTADNFDEFLKNDYVLVEFYAPWCGHCQKLAPQYSIAATTLKEQGSGIQLGKVDATIEQSLGERFSIKGYPTLKFFRQGEPIEYDGGRTAAEIVNWVTKKSGPPSKTLTTQAEIDAYVAASGTRGLAFVSADQEATWVNVAKSEKVQAFAFAHVSDAALWGDRKAGTVELHKDGEAVQTFDGAFETASLLTWFVSEGFPLVDILSQESFTRAQTSQKDILAIFLTESDAEITKAATEVAKAFKNEIVVTTSDQVGIASRWGSSGNLFPTAIYLSNMGGQPSFTVWNEDSAEAINTETLKAFVTGSRDGTYPSWIKSEPIPESNDGPVVVVVGKTFDEIVNAKKDVLVEFYAPWCGHCKKLAPLYEELGAAYKDDDNVVIAKMDATANAPPKSVNIQGFPTIILFTANNEQISYDGERDLESFKKWIAEKRVSKPSAERDEL